MATPNYVDAFINAYNAGYKDVPQERMNPFTGATDQAPMTGENMSFDDVGISGMNEKSTRFAKLTYGDADFRRRWWSPRWFYPDPKLVDKQDAIAQHADPTSAFMRNMMYAIERKKRDVIIEAMDKTVVGGKAPGDVSGGYTFDTTNAISVAAGRTIVHDTDLSGAVGGTSTGMTAEKIILAQTKFSDLGVPDGSPINFCCSFRQIADLRRRAELQGTDTSTIQALMQRRIPDGFMGINKWIVTNSITIGSSNDLDSDTNVFECFFWIPEGIMYSAQTAPTFAVDRLPDRVGDTWQIKADFGCNAIRMHEDLVLKCECILETS